MLPVNKIKAKMDTIPDEEITILFLSWEYYVLAHFYLWVACLKGETFRFQQHTLNSSDKFISGLQEDLDRIIIINIKEKWILI